MRPMFLAILVLLLCVFVSPSHSAARAGLEPDKPLLHGLFTDNMVLQRGIAVPVWGWAAPGQRVTVSLRGAGLPTVSPTALSATATADADGKWMARIGPLNAGGPYTLSASALAASGARTETRSNVLIGDVWICSGQSNMEWPVAASNDAQAEIAAANYPQIRLFTVPKTIATEPRRDVQSQWQVCSPATVGEFSAVGYFFGRHLNRDLKVPVGLIDSSWGGTVAEAWVSAGALRTMSDFRPAVAAFDRNVAALRSGNTDFDRLMADWWMKNDPGTAGRWANADFDDSAWKTMSLPQPWEGAGLPAFDGLVWFRRSFELGPNSAGRDLTLRLGTIDDRDTTWVNGVQVGQSNEHNAQRVYRVPAGVLRAGRNTLAVRVLDTGGAGGFYSAPDALRLEGPAGSTPISLAGEWKYQVSTPLAQTTPVPQRLDNNPNATTVLYNGMIAPLVPYGIKGALWYQGESNAGRAVQYQTLLPTLIRDWRTRFGVGEFPFLIVQLANFMATSAQPDDPPWAHLREAQALTARNLPNTGLALAIDIGEAGDIHPRNKQEVGRRLALAARGIAYRQPVTYAGPTYRAMRREANTLRLFFDHAEGLTAKDIPAAGGSLRGFAIAGADGRFVWADARIDGNTVVVSSPQVPDPSAVRYAWANNPVANLTNRAGLPAAPFRTDKGAG